MVLFSINCQNQLSLKGLATEIQNNDIFLKSLKYDTGTILPQIWNISD
jgi:hypothetical protein